VNRGEQLCKTNKNRLLEMAIVLCWRMHRMRVFLTLLALISLACGAESLNRNLLNTFGQDLLIGTPGPADADGEAFLARFTLAMPNSIDPNVERVTRECEALWTHNFCIMTIRPNSEPLGDTQTRGRYFRRMLVEFGPERSQMREDVTTQMRDTNTYSMLWKYRIGDRNIGGLHLFDHFCLAVGRSFGRYLEEVVSQEEGSSATLRRLDALGRFGQTFPGKWDITYEPRSQNLVRSALFVPNGSSSAVLKVTNSGTMSCPGLSIAAGGAFVAGNVRFDFQILSLTNVSSRSDTFKDCTNRFFRHMNAPAAPGKLTVMDLRGSEVKRSAN